MKRRYAVLLVLSAIMATPATAKDLPQRAGAIASAHPLATAAGMEILAAGGNAFDAAVAVSAALGVVEPFSSGFGGGGFWLLYRAEDSHEVMIDGRETAPAAASRDMYLDAAGQPIPGASREGPLAAGIPGIPAALEHMSRDYGRLPLKQCIQPAIRLARDGFPVYDRMLRGLTFRRELLRRWPAAPDVYLVDGELPELGHVIRQPDLAMVLERFAAQGRAGFYTGPVAEQLVGGARDAGGIWTLQDLAGYRVKERPPIVFRYRDARIVTAPPPSAGGVALANMLHILEGFELQALDRTQVLHLTVEAMRRAYRDRAEYLGDPDFVDVPVERLTHPFYAAGQRASIRLDRATPSSALPSYQGQRDEGRHTTHFSVMDAEGNRVAGTQTINSWFGSGFMAPGTGVLFNNEMDDFSIKPGVENLYRLVGASANAVAPGKRPLSSMTPTFVESDRGVLILGTPGGSRIITMVMLGILDWLGGADATGVAGLPRYHHQFLPDRITYEPEAITAAQTEALEALGHELQKSSRLYGNMNVVTWDNESGAAAAAADPRAQGGAAWETDDGTRFVESDPDTYGEAEIRVY